MNEELTVDSVRIFHSRIAGIIEAVQAAIWQQGVHELLGYSTDFAFGQLRGVQTLVLKTKGRSAYIRLNWDALMSESASDRELVDRSVKAAINELR